MAGCCGREREWTVDNRHTVIYDATLDINCETGLFSIEDPSMLHPDCDLQYLAAIQQHTA